MEILHQFIDEKGRFDAANAKRRFFQPWQEPIPAEGPRELSDAIIAASNLCFGKPKELAEVMDVAGARALFGQKVLRKNRVWVWADVVAHLRTHQPKTRNDKVSSVGVFAVPRVESEEAKQYGWLSSSSCCHHRRVSGAGNGASVSHYSFLSMVLALDGEVASVVEFAERDHPWLKASLLNLGAQEADWSALLSGAKRLQEDLPTFVDRQLKQIFIPVGDQMSQRRHVLVTPLPSTRMVADFFAAKNALYEKKGAGVPTRSMKIGGAQPQNAGSLALYRNGHFQLLKAGFPKAGLNELERLLYRLVSSRKLIVYRKADMPELKALSWLLKSDWEERPESLETLRSRVEKHVTHLLASQVERLFELRTAMRGNQREALVKNIPSNALKKTPSRIRELLFLTSPSTEIVEEHPQLSLDLQIYVSDEIVASLASALEGVDDSHFRLLQDAVDALLEKNI